MRVPVGAGEGVDVPADAADGVGDGTSPVVGSEITSGVGVGVLLGRGGVSVGVEDGARVSVGVGDGSGVGVSAMVGSDIAVDVGVADISTTAAAVAVSVGVRGVTLDVEVGVITAATGSCAVAPGAST